MAYEKIAAEGGEPKILAFYYTVESLLNAASLWSLYKSVHKVEGDILDEIALTVDEQDVFETQLSDGVFDIMNRFLKYTKDINNAILFNESYTPSGGQAALSVVLKIVDYETYNTNYLKPIDRLIEKTIRFYALKEWFSMKDLDNDAAKANASYLTNLNELLVQSMHLKKAPIVV